MSSGTINAVGVGLSGQSGVGAFAGNNSPTLITPLIQGVIDGSSASSGYVGEIIENSVDGGSAVSITSGVDKTILSISLTAGDWDVWANLVLFPQTLTVPISFSGSISNTDNTMAVPPNGGAYFIQNNTALPANGIQGIPVGMTRISISSTSTYYLVVNSFFSISTCQAYGYIGARRVR